MIVSLLFLALLSLLLAAHSFVTYPLSLLLLRALLSNAPAQDSDTKTKASLACGRERIAMLMCAYNEERVIQAKIDNLLSLRGSEPDLEIHVYVDAGNDRTGEILQGYGAQIHLHLATERHGKTHGMNLLVAKTQAPLLVFTDANVLVDCAALTNLRRQFDDPAVGCVAGTIKFTNADESVTAGSGTAYWRFEEWLKRLEGETGSVMGATGGLFAIRASAHRPAPDHIIDDMYVSFMTLCAGFRIVQATDVIGYEESVSSMREEFRRKVRIACQAFNAHRLIWPELAKAGPMTIYKYISHKYLRWLTIYFLAAAAIFFEMAVLAASMPQLALLLLGCGLLAVEAGHYRKVKPFVQIVDLLSAFLGTGLGVWRSVRGELYQTWTPAASIRKS